MLLEYIAHKADDGREQSVKNHLEDVAKLAEKYAAGFLGSAAYTGGLTHDIGKYTLAFQKRINGSGIRTEHAVQGAVECGKLFGGNILIALLQYCIVGHHSGLPDGGASADGPDSPTLQGRLSRAKKLESGEAYKNEITISAPDDSQIIACMNEIMHSSLSDKEKNREYMELYAFMTRYVFSCLTDADFIDTETFCDMQAERGMTGDFEEALRRLDAHMSGFKADTKVRIARRELQHQAYELAQNGSSVELLNMPTGSGKTLCSLKIALEKAVKDGKKRIIYVIPYTSIIEQTAEEFEKILGDSVEILQHHSNFSFDVDKDNKNDKYDENDLTVLKMKHTAENWDAKLIITTSVQFFQSLYHYKGSRLRKLHNLADSVIIFDEIHLLPIKYLQPCIRAVGYITKYLRSTAIFLSATMPDYTGLFGRYLGNDFTQLITDKTHFADFKKCQYIDLGKTSFENVVMKASESMSSLIIVNTRAEAQQVYKMLSGVKYHLSTYMIPEHRSAVIKKIRQHLKDIADNVTDEKLTVVSTSLVEAGVDFDFQTVFRELAGLDSILQAGGRCNREGSRSDGCVYIFDADDTPHKNDGDFGTRRNITKKLLEKFSDITAPECIETYFSRLFEDYDELIQKNSIYECSTGKSLMSIPFRKYAESFQLINDDDSIAVVVEYDENASKLIARLRAGDMKVKRKLQRYSVPVPKKYINELMKSGLISECNGVCLLTNKSYYTDEMGLDINTDLDAQNIV